MQNERFVEACFGLSGEAFELQLGDQVHAVLLLKRNGVVGADLLNHVVVLADYDGDLVLPRRLFHGLSGFLF